jgi:leucyl aminopeptidase
LADAGAEFLICFRFADGDHALPRTDPAAMRLGRALGAWEAESGFSAGLAETIVLHPQEKSLPGLVGVVGLGRRSDFSTGDLFKAAATAARLWAPLAARTAAVPLDGLRDLPGVSWEAAVETVSAGLHAGAYKFSRFLPPSGRGSKRSAVLLASRRDRRISSSFRAGDVVGAAVNRIRDLANLPANEASPLVVADMARRLASELGLGYSLWRSSRLRAEKCRALLAVGQGSRNEPCLIVVKHPGRRKSLRPVVLVGKTITFDTGGISLKPAKSMEWMKYDKSGGMAVLGAMAAIGRLKPARPVIAILAAAENMPGASATRPGDIVRSRAGKTIEIVNTDAEGRLVLADALSVALDFDPHRIVDLATLTGAAVTALGHITSAVMGNTSSLVEELRAAGEATGERLWPMPLYPAYAGMLKSPFADLRNTGDGTAGAIAGGMFLREFVDDRTPWAHIDLTHAWEEQDRPHAAAGATLFGARLLVEWLRRNDA